MKIIYESEYDGDLVVQFVEKCKKAIAFIDKLSFYTQVYINDKMSSIPNDEITHIYEYDKNKPELPK